MYDHIGRDDNRLTKALERIADSLAKIEKYLKPKPVRRKKT